MNNDAMRQGKAALPGADAGQAGFGALSRRLGSGVGSLAGVSLLLWELIAYGALLTGAAVMRLWDLGFRAVHHDESLHSFYSWQLAQGSGFRHDPLMHGPFQFEATAAIFFIFGDSDYTSRLLYAVAGIALVALPLFFRSRLGRLGALFTSVMLAFSPALLYFSRFARNDILMAVWALGLVICMWRYIDADSKGEGKNRYIYIAAALLALAFASKETAYLITALLGLFLALWLLFMNAPRILRKRGHTHRRDYDLVGNRAHRVGVAESARAAIVAARSGGVPAHSHHAHAADVVGGYRHIAGNAAAELVEPDIRDARRRRDCRLARWRRDTARIAADGNADGRVGCHGLLLGP